MKKGFIKPKVAILLATYNGAPFVEEQIRSLVRNETPFTLHWIDDGSTDDTCAIVRVTAKHTKIHLAEWPHSQHLGVPAIFFELLERADADIYLFCDQDDIWQPGKIDATVGSLVPDVTLPVLCFTDPLMFRDEDPRRLYRWSEVTGAKIEHSLQEARLFMSATALGHTQGFTRSLRDIFSAHKEIARTYAAMHDMWMYAIAIASGTVRILDDAPTTLYRWHSGNTSDKYSSWTGRGVGRLSLGRHQIQRIRRSLSRHAEGFLLASPTLPCGPALERLRSVARLVATLDRRQSPIELARLASRGIIWPSRRLAFQLITTCLFLNASQ